MKKIIKNFLGIFILIATLSACTYEVTRSFVDETAIRDDIVNRECKEKHELCMIRCKNNHPVNLDYRGKCFTQCDTLLNLCFKSSNPVIVERNPLMEAEVPVIIDPAPVWWGHRYRHHYWH